MRIGTPRMHRRQAAACYQDVEIDLTLLAFRGLMPTMFAAVISTAGLTASLALHYGDHFLAVYTFVTLAASSTRAAVVARYSRLEAGQLTLQKARRCQAIYGAATLVHCSILCVTVFYTFRVLPSAAQWLCTIGIFSICLGLSSRMGMRPWIVQISGGSLLLTLIVSIALGKQSMHWGAVIILTFFTAQFLHATQNQFMVAVEQLRLRRKFRALSEQDVLTGLANRRHFESSLGTLCTSSQLFAILFIDLDRFKHVNDLYGHAAGDTLLIQVSERLRSTIRPSDLLARLGGDEFAILQTPLLSHDSNDSAKALATRINSAISEPFLIAGQTVSIGASIGIRLSSAGLSDANTLLSKADQALYLVKQAGGGSFSLATV